MIYWNSSVVPRQFSGEGTVFLTNGAGVTVYPHAKEWIGILTSGNAQMLTHNGS